jgi:hypothetical protein
MACDWVLKVEVGLIQDWRRATLLPGRPICENLVSRGFCTSTQREASSGASQHQTTGNSCLSGIWCPYSGMGLAAQRPFVVVHCWWIQNEQPHPPACLVDHRRCRPQLHPRAASSAARLDRDLAPILCQMASRSMARLCAQGPSSHLVKFWGLSFALLWPLPRLSCHLDQAWRHGHADFELKSRTEYIPLLHFLSARLFAIAVS